MLTLNQIRDNTDEVIEKLKIKNFDARKILNQVLEIDKKRRLIQSDTNALEGEMNSISRNIGLLFKEGKTDEANKLKKKSLVLKEKVKELNQKLNTSNTSLEDLLVQLPNIPHKSTPAGKSSDQNQLIRQGGSLPELKDSDLPHWELASTYKLIDFVHLIFL